MSVAAPHQTASPPSDCARLDVWLWRARFFKTRGTAAAFVGKRGVRVLRAGAKQKTSKAGWRVRVGDVLTFAAPVGLRCVRVEGLGKRRGPPAEARMLYVDVSQSGKGDDAGLGEVSHRQG